MPALAPKALCRAQGFRRQMRSWPEQPVTTALAWLRTIGGPDGLDVVDFGCGDAALTAGASPRHRVTSLDLVASAPGIIACNMSQTPLGKVLGPWRPELQCLSPRVL